VWQIGWYARGVYYQISSRTTDYDVARSLLQLVRSQQLAPPLPSEVWTSLLGERRCKGPDCTQVISPLLDPQREYCSRRCHEEALRIRRGGARSLEKKCEGCGKPFTTARMWQRYCEPGCAKRERNRKHKLDKAQVSGNHAGGRHQVGAKHKWTAHELERGRALHREYGSWRRAVKEVRPDEWKQDPKAAADRLRLAANYPNKRERKPK
jgi:hypothetical protein